MTPWDDGRGQSVQIGAVLLFAALVVLFASYQAVVVPQQNERAEHDHSRAVAGDMTELRNAIVSAAGDAAPRAVSVRLGTQYPGRLLAVNPAPPTGQLRTVGTTDPAVNATIDNATAFDSETRDFWDGTRRNYSTGSLFYRPAYNEYAAPPTTVYEHSLLADEFDGGTVPLAGQALVSGDRISLVALNGSLSASGSDARAVDVRPQSAAATTVAVTDDESGNVTLRLPTRLSRATWEAALADEYVPAKGGDGHVRAVRTNPHPADGFRELVVELEGGVNYTVQLAKAGVGSRARGEGPAYATTVRGDGAAVPEGGTARLVVEVRDRFDNPVDGVPVSAATDGPGSVTVLDPATGDDGRVAVRYEAPANVDGDPPTAAINASFAGDPAAAAPFDPRAPEHVQFGVEVRNTDGSGLGGGGGDEAFAVEWADPREDNGDAALSCSAPDACTWDVANSSDRTLTVRGVTSPAVQDTELQFGVDDREVGSLSRYAATTGDDGTATATLTAESEGTVTLFVAGGGTSRALELEIDMPPGERDPGHPFEDVNGDGLYQAGTDVALSASDVEGSYDAGPNGLVVPEGARALSADSVDWSADGVRLATDLSVTQGASIDAGGGDLTVDGVTVSAQASIDLTGGDVAVDGATLTTADGWGGVTIDASGSLAGEGATIRSRGDASITADSVMLDGATLDSSLGGDGWGGLSVTATDGAVSLVNADVEALATVSVEGASVDLTNASANTQRNGGYGDVQLQSTSGTVVVERATLSAGGSLSADAADENGDDGDLFVADAELYEGGRAGTMDNANRADVVGSPAVGRVQPR